MIKNKISIWFWQQMVTPHMAYLAAALADRGFEVNYVANQILSDDRIKLGWAKPKLRKARLIIAVNKADFIQQALNAPDNSIHLSQGLRGNGLVGIAQKIIRKRRLIHWVMMESIDDYGFFGLIKKYLYQVLFIRWIKHLAGILAIGNNSLTWFVKRGVDRNKIYSFAYFLEEPQIKKIIKLPKKNKNRPFRIIFVGRLIKLKRLDLLIKSVASLKKNNIELWVIGNGPEKRRLKSLATLLLPKQVFWFGVIPIKKIPNIINQVDCLVLPSRYDGWGAVVSEALMVGTPVICSNKCGSSGAVLASGYGSVFSANNQASLINSLRKQYKKGFVKLKERQKLRKWAKYLGSASGAKYLEKIIISKNKKINLIKLPWN